MITVRLTTWVNAPVERCFLLAANADLSSAQAHDLTRAPGQSTLQLGDTLSWQLSAVGMRRQSYMSRVEAIRPFSYFREVMVAGIFRHYEHDHHFAWMDDGTRVRDEIRFTTRLGVLGRVFEVTLLRAALMKMLVEKNTQLKQLAESNDWRKYIGNEDVGQEKIRVSDASPRVTNMQRFA